MSNQKWEKFKQELAEKNQGYLVTQYEAVQSLVRLYADNPSDTALFVSVLHAIARLPIACDILVASNDHANEFTENYFFNITTWTDEEVETVLNPENNQLQSAIDILKEHKK